MLARQPQLDDPQVGWEMRGKVELQREAIGARHREGRVHGAAGVDDQHVARAQKAAQVAEARMLHVIVRAVRDHQTDLVAGQATRLRRLAGLELGGQLEIQVRHLTPSFS